VTLFLRINKATYDANEKKIIFVLSFMNAGTASAWALNFGSRRNLGTWEAFVKEVKDTFSPVDNARMARTEMKTLKQGDDLEEYINQFLLLMTRSGLTEDTALIKYFMDRLKPTLLDKIFTMENVLTTLKDMIKAMSKFNGNWRRAKAITGRA
jgi:Retrotransposon gag protein